MGVRNCADIGENLQKIVTLLMLNDRLVSLLYYTAPDPYSAPSLTKEEKQTKVFNKLIRIIPKVEPSDLSNSIIAISVLSGKKISENTEYRDVQIMLEVFVPMTQWIIKDTNLRPFAIMGEIQKSLDGSTINGLGKLQGGDFELSYLTEEMACYKLSFSIVNYE